ncbi:AUGMIN subunit 3 [Camellia lanceoleosa]|uniref:AUGMIN subunit 3 n=1 Tax=Camellia lanceoleosa TaxID=1840588 RepID=A0ACC0GU02_9ERIC|nr:AUGMIN subunit 3 [Camellia lanceoleosa]
MKGQLSRTPSVASNAYKRSDLRLLLGVLGAPLSPVQVSANDPLPHLCIKDTPIKALKKEEQSSEESNLLHHHQGPYRLVAEEGKAKCSWVSLDDVSNILVRGARDLARPPTITDIYHSAMEKAKNREEKAEEAKKEEEESEEGKRVLKRNLRFRWLQKQPRLQENLSRSNRTFVLCKNDVLFLRRRIGGFMMDLPKGLDPKKMICVEEKDDKITRSSGSCAESIVEEEKTEVASIRKMVTSTEGCYV